MKKIILLLFVLGISIHSGFSQGRNLQSFTPSALIGKNNWEFKTFENLYYETKSFGESPFEKRDNGEGNRVIYFTSINQFLYGLTPHLNVGFDVWVNNVNQKMDNLTRNRWGVSGFGPKIKIVPIPSVERLSLQSTLLFPISDDLEGRDPEAEQPGLFLAFDRTLWLNQLFYDRQLSSKWQIFLQAAAWYSIVRDSFVENNFLDTQFSGFLSYFPDNKWTIYGMVEYTPRHYDYDNQEVAPFNVYFGQTGLGLKYQIIPNFLEIEGLYTNFILGSEGNGAGQTFNLGLRMISQ